MDDSTNQLFAKFTGVDEMVGDFRNLEAGVKKVTDALLEQVGAVGKLAAATAQLGQQADAATTKAVNASKERIKTNAEEASTFEKVLSGLDKFHEATKKGTEAWSKTKEGLSGYTEAAETLLKTQQKFKALNLGPQDTARGIAAVNDVVAKMPGLKLSEMTESLADLSAAFGSLNESVALLPSVGKMQLINEMLFGADPKEAEENIMTTLKAAKELAGVKPGANGETNMSSEERDRTQQYLDIASQMQVWTGGKFGGEDMEKLASTGIGEKELSPDAMRKMVYIFGQIGGGRKGSALVSEMMSVMGLQSGGGDARSLQNLSGLGLLKGVPAGSSPEQMLAILQSEGLAGEREDGRLRTLKSGAFPASDLVGTDPFRFADAIAKAIQEHGAAVMGHPVDVTDAKAVGALLARLTGSAKPMNELGQFIAERGSIQGGYGNVARIGGMDSILKRGDDDPLTRMRRFQASWENFQQQVGGPILDILSQMAERLRPIIDLVGHHPDVAAWTATFIGMSRGLSLLSSAASSVQGMASGLGGALGATQDGFGKLDNALNRLPQNVQVGIAVVGVAAAIEQLWQLYQEYQKTKQAWADATSSAKQSVDVHSKLAAIDPAKAKQTQWTGAEVWSKLNSENVLMDALNYNPLWGGISEIGNPFVGMLGGFGGDPHKAYAGMAPELNQPEVMESFLKYERGRAGLTSEQSKSVEGNLEAVFPQSFKAAAEHMSQSQEGASKSAETLKSSGLDPLTAQAGTFGAEIQSDTGLLMEFGGRVKNVVDLLPGGGDGKGGRKDGGPSGGLTPPFPSSVLGGGHGLSSILGGKGIGHASGGLVRRDHAATVHEGELITRAPDVSRLVAAAAGGSQGRPGHTVNVTVNGGGDGRETARLVAQAVSEALEDQWTQNRRNTEALKDRTLMV